MKITQLFFTLFLLPFFAFGQTAFKKHYGTPSNFDGFTKVVKTADGNFLAAGTTATLGADNYDILLQKFGEDGTLIWEKIIDGGSHDQVNDLIAHSTGGFLLTGYTETNSGNRQYLLLRLDEEGEEIWNNTGGNIYPDEGHSLAELPNGNIVMTTSAFNETATPVAVDKIYEFDADGVLLNENQLSQNIEHRNGMVASEDGNIFAPQPGSNRIYKFSLDGSLIFDFEVVTVNGLPLESPRLFKHPNGQLIVAGFEQANSQPAINFFDDNGTASNPSTFSGLSVFITSEANNVVVIDDETLWIGIGNFFSNRTAAVVKYSISSDEILESANIEDWGFTDVTLTSSMALADGGGVVLAGTTFSTSTGDNAFRLGASDDLTANWVTTFGLEAPVDTETGRMIVQTSDGGFILAGSKYNEGMNQDIWVIRTDEDGNVIWETSLGGESFDGVNALNLTPEEDIIVTGHTVVQNDQLAVYKLDPDGNLLWNKVFDYMTGDRTFDADIAANGDILIAFPYLNDQFLSFGALLRLTPNGEVNTFSTFDFGAGLTLTYAVSEMADGNILIGGCGDEPGYFEAFILKVNPAGVILESSVISPGQNFDCFITIYENQAGEILANGIGFPSGESLNALVTKLNPDFSTVYSKYIFPDPAQNEQSQFSWFSQLDEQGNQVLFGDQDYSFPDTSGFRQGGAISQLDANGNVVLKSVFGRKQNAVFRGGLFTSDGGFAAIGSAIFDKSLDAYFVKTLADGTVDWQTTLAPPFELKVGPNPASDFINYSVEGLTPGPFSVQIFTTDGTIIRSKNHVFNAVNLRRTLNVSDLPSGLYYFQVRQEGRSVTLNWVKN